MSRPIYHTFNGRTMTLHGWAHFVGINYTTVTERIKCGWPPEDAIFKPVGEKTDRKIVRRGNAEWHALSDVPRGMSAYRRSR